VTTSIVTTLIRACRAALCLAALAPAVGACASIVSGTTQDIGVTSDPDSADCTLMREGQAIGTIRTPGQVKVKRDSRTIRVDCRKDGHEDGRVFLFARYETASAGNIALGGFVGMAIDQATGASNRYDTSVLVRLEPAAPGTVAAAPRSDVRVAPAPPAAERQPSEAVAAVPAPPVFEEGSWQASTELVPDRSPETCARFEASHYNFSLHGDMLTIGLSTGDTFETAVGADGAVNYRFRTPANARLILSGNAKTRRLELQNLNSSCVWVFTSA
jgi:hypothetical protein